jgi:hypothetical protein
MVGQLHTPTLKAHLAAQGTVFPGYIEQEFEDYLKCGRLEHGFLRVRFESCHADYPRRVQLQAPGVLPQLRGATHDRVRGAAGR